MTTTLTRPPSSMRPPPRITRSSTSSIVLSPRLSERPHPTLSDITLPPRRRLRDGSSSRGSTISSSSSSSRGVRGMRRGQIASQPINRGRTVTSTARNQRRVLVRHDSDEEASVFTNDIADDLIFEPSFSDTSLTPPPPEDPPQPLTGRAERRDLLTILDQTSDDVDLPRPTNTDRHTRQVISQPFPLERTNSASGSASTSISDPESAARRFTAQEKGKGRAIISSPIAVEDEVDVNGDDSIQVIGVRSAEKRKRTPIEDAIVIHDARGLGEDEERGLGSFTCPVCFCAPTQAVMTFCGHILCAKCLLDSLTAAIKRNPNPHPVRHHLLPTRGRGRGRGRGGSQVQPTGRAGYGGSTEWTVDTLRSAWFRYKETEYEKKLMEQGIEREQWDAIKAADMEAPREDSLVIKEELKGLWTIDGKDCIVEGECPVCRKPLPGGFAPPKSGIGGFVPLEIRVAGRDIPNGVRKRR